MTYARRTLPSALAMVPAASACGPLPGRDGGAKPSSAAPAKPGDLLGGRHYRTGWFGQDGNSDGFGQFSLLDPVGKKHFSSLREDDADGPAFGTRIEDAEHPGITPGIDPQPGVRNPVEVDFPPIPAGVGQIAMLGPGTLGEMTGIPVLDSGKARAPVPAASDTGSEAPKPKRGQAFFHPVTAPKGRIWSRAQDLHDYSEGPQKSTTTGGGEEKIALRTDVLFAFDKANLSPKATSVLDDAIDQTRKQADPAKPPITITGFTDAKVGDAYNQKLSVRRATAVQKYISAKLGDAYRSLSRSRPGAPGAPGAFRPGDGRPVGSVRTPHAGSSVNARLDVYPFHRDGAYVVGVFNVHNDAGSLQQLSPGLGDADTKAVGGATLDGVTVTDETSKTRAYVTRYGDFATDGNAAFVEGTVGFLDRGEDGRLYAYYPAPPAGVTKVDVTAANWGSVRDVPIQ